MLYSEEILYEVRCAVVRGDIEGLRAHHDEYIRRVLLVFQNPGISEPEHADYELGSSIQLMSNQQAVALSCALTVLALAFPQDVSTFDLGAMHVERAILRWNMHNDSRDEDIELGTDGSDRGDSYDVSDTGGRDENYYFSKLWCGCNRDLHITRQIQEASQ
jgi:hypothetical protein